MSYTKRSHVSAYHVYSSSQNAKSNRNNQSYSTDGGKNHGHATGMRKEKTSGGLSSRDSRRHRARSYESDESYTSKGLLSSSQSRDHSSDKQRMSESSSRRDVILRHTEGNKKPALSLMDIELSINHNSTSKGSLSKWKNSSSHHGYSSNEESSRHADERGDWKGGRRFSKYSDSEDEADLWQGLNKGRRTWRTSSTLSNPAGYSSQPAPLIVDMAERSSNSVHKRVSGDNQPKPLLETYIPHLIKKPISLLDLPNTDSRNDSRFKRKPPHRSDHPSRERKSSYHVVTDSERKADQRTKVSTSSRKRTASEDDQEPPVKKFKVVKPKNESKDKIVAMDSDRISVCRGGGHTFLIIPSALTSLYLHGRAKITVLMGTISILGCKLRVGSVYDVYSPASGSLLAMQSGDDSKFKASDVKEELSKFGIPENDRNLEGIGNSTISVLMVDKLESAVCDYVTSFIPYTQIFTATPCRDQELAELKGVTLSKLSLKVAPMKEMVSTCMNMSQEYEDVLSKWAKKLSDNADARSPPVVMCCGAKNTGKSTLNRWLVNTSLKSVSAVAYLECDVGQTEFSPPATMSLHILKQPILGPPFCHQRHAEQMVFYGETSPSHDPSFYIKCLKFIVEAYHDLCSTLPLIVNAMGFLEGIGLMLLRDTVHLVKPDLMVQIDSFNQAVNLPALTPEFIAKGEGWMYNKTPAVDTKQKTAETPPHELVHLTTLISQRRDFSFKLKPVDLRNLSLLAALALDLDKGMTLTSLPPYVVPYVQFGMHVCHHRLSGEEILAAVDACVVALCVADLSQAERKNEDLPLVFPEMPVCTCLGLGFVRAVDVKKGLLYLVTTLPRVRLRKMNTILKGSLALPDQIFLKQTSSGPVPYVDALAPSTAVASVRPRSRMPRVSLGANK